MNDVVVRLLKNAGESDDDEIDKRDIDTVLSEFVEEQGDITDVIEGSRKSLGKNSDEIFN